MKTEQTEQTPESPLPWDFEKETHSCTRIFRRLIGGSATIGNVYSAEDAKYIVHCVNTHAAMVEALKGLIDGWVLQIGGNAALNAAIVALRQAEEGK